MAPEPHVQVELGRLPQDCPESTFDLIVVSEFLYYFGKEDLIPMVARLESSLEPGGTLVAVHWRRPVPDHPVTGEAVHHTLRGRPELSPLAHHEEEDFLLLVLVKRPGLGPPQSVAAATGVPGAASQS